MHFYKLPTDPPIHHTYIFTTIQNYSISICGSEKGGSTNYNTKKFYLVFSLLQFRCSVLHLHLSANIFSYVFLYIFSFGDFTVVCISAQLVVKVFNNIPRAMMFGQKTKRKRERVKGKGKENWVVVAKGNGRPRKSNIRHTNLNLPIHTNAYR